MKIKSTKNHFPQHFLFSTCLQSFPNFFCVIEKKERLQTNINIELELELE